MSNLISTSSIASGSIIFPEHVLRSILALRGETDNQFILSGSLIVSASSIKFPNLLQNNNISNLLAFNTSSGDLYFVTGGLVGPAGPSGSSGPIGPSGSMGLPGDDGNGITDVINNGNGTLTFVFTDSTSYTTPNLIGPSGSQGPAGPAGEDIVGGINVTNSQIRYTAYLGGSSDRVEILSTADTFTRKSWSRSNTTVNISSPTHSLSNGDYVVVRNINEDYVYSSITVIDSNTFSVTVNNTGITAGNLASYTPAFKVTSFTQAGMTVNSPSSGKAQLNSINISTGVKSSSTFTIIMPSSISNGAGDNNSLITQNPPIVQAYRLSNGTIIGSTALSLNTSSNFNQFQVVGLASLVNNLIRLTF
jgi:hypothetical protein